MSGCGMCRYGVYNKGISVSLKMLFGWFLQLRNLVLIVPN